MNALESYKKHHDALEICETGTIFSTSDNSIDSNVLGGKLSKIKTILENHLRSHHYFTNVNFTQNALTKYYNYIGLEKLYSIIKEIKNETDMSQREISCAILCSRYIVGQALKSLK